MDENSTISRALKNPVVVLGLCAIAGVSVYDNIVGSHTDLLSPMMEAAAPFLGESQAAVPPSRQAHEAEATQWIQNPRRDPFAPAPVLARTTTPADRSSTVVLTPQEKKPQPLQHFELKAIALDRQERSAVINRSVVYEGEMIDGYHVVAIELQGVWLKRRGKTHLLRFKTLTTS